MKLRFMAASSITALTICCIIGQTPSALAADRFFISDKGEKRVYTYTNDFTPVINWSTAVENGAPDDVYITFDDVFILDQSTKKVFRYDYGGGGQTASRALKVAGASASDIGTPRGMTVSPSTDELFITDHESLFVYSLSTAFTSGSSIIATSQYPLHSSNEKPQGLAVDETYAYVLDFEQARLYRYLRNDPAAGYTLSRRLQTEAGATLTKPEGIAVFGNIVYVLNNDSANIAYKYSLGDMFDGATGVNAAEAYPLAVGNSDPYGIGVDSARASSVSDWDVY